MSARCYGTDGNSNSDRYIPCNQTAVDAGQHSTCCANGDKCMTNGLCQAGSDNQKGMNLFWRNGCTDPTWQDPACPKYCVGLDKPDTQAVYYCLEGTSWCCMPREHVTDLGTLTNTTCCSISDLTFAAPSPLVYTSAMKQGAKTATQVPSSLKVATVSTAGTSTTSTASSATAPTTATSSADVQTSSAAASGSGSSSKLGIYVGVPIGIVALLAIIAAVVLVMRKRKRMPTDHSPQQPPVYETEAKHPTYQDHYTGSQPSELPHERVVYAELPDTRMR